jgi:hypothetical protein
VDLGWRTNGSAAKGGGVGRVASGEVTIFSWDRRDGESLADYVRRLEAMLRPGLDEPRIDIFDSQIKQALNEAKALLTAHAGKDRSADEVRTSARLSAVKKACESLTAQERAELLRWLSENMRD